MADKSMSDRFWSKVDKSGDCWVWTAGTCKDGYGKFKNAGKTLRAHRHSWLLHNGNIPEGLQVLHHCDNPPCIRPEHLFVGTNQDNMQDKARKGRCRTIFGQEHANCKLSPDDIQAICDRYAVGGVSQYKLAEEYGVTQPHVSNVINGKRRVARG